MVTADKFGNHIMNLSLNLEGFQAHLTRVEAKRKILMPLISLAVMLRFTHRRRTKTPGPGPKKVHCEVDLLLYFAAQRCLLNSAVAWSRSFYPAPDEANWARGRLCCRQLGRCSLARSRSDHLKVSVSLTGKQALPLAPTRHHFGGLLPSTEQVQEPH